MAVRWQENVVLQWRDMDTISKTAERLKHEGFTGITEYTLRKWVREGSIPSVKAGNKSLIWWPNVCRFLRGGSSDGQSL